MMESHNRVILHIDIDCFYAQVEMNKRPDLREKPLGIQQKNIVVTCNYPARAMGVGKCMSVSKALELCPSLELVNGEDLAEYRRVSAAVNSTLCETGSPVERLGMDENWLDVTQMVNMRLKEASQKQDFRGNVYGELVCDDYGCDCVARLTVGTIVADELRNVLKTKFNLTTSAGIAHNKLLAKLVGSKNKPNDQTVIASSAVPELIKPDHLVTSIPGIGKRTGEVLMAAGIKTVQHLRDCTFDTIPTTGLQRSQMDNMKQLAWGTDTSEVKMSGRPASVGLEDRFVGIYNKEECREKLTWLLGRLTALLVEDGRKPTNIKVTVRDYFKDKAAKKFTKESRQTRISPRLFQPEEGRLNESNQKEIIDVCLGLLGKMIDYTDAFHITLMGLSVTDFQDQVEKKSSIKKFFISPQKSDVPQSIPTDEIKRKNLFSDKIVASPEAMTFKKFKADTYDLSTCSSEKSFVISDNIACPKGYDREVWASLPHKMKNELIHEDGRGEETTNQNYSSYTSTEEKESTTTTENQPANLLLGDEALGHDGKDDAISAKTNNPPLPDCPDGCDPEIFNQLPMNVKVELVESSKFCPKERFQNVQALSAKKSKSKKSTGCKPAKKNSILNYFSRN